MFGAQVAGDKLQPSVRLLGRIKQTTLIKGMMGKLGGALESFDAYGHQQI